MLSVGAGGDVGVSTTLVAALFKGDVTSSAAEGNEVAVGAILERYLDCGWRDRSQRLQMLK